jgi:signal transduction histidine kinase
MKDTEQENQQLAALADHLAGRRQAILENWRSAVDNDAALTAASTLSRREFYDHIPAVLDVFEEILRALRLVDKKEAAEEQKEHAAEHGLHRWHHGYHQQDVMREWGHLHLCLVNELENYAGMNRDHETDVMPTARRALARLCSGGVVESAARYAAMQQVEAAGRVRDVEQALAQLKELERKRIEIWREAVHDLRGSFGVVKNVTEVLNDAETIQTERAEFLSLLQNSVRSLHNLLDNLLVLSRLEAGHEQRDLTTFDAAAVLGELCTVFQSLATERRLFLRAEGPPSLPVQGDAVKVQRVAQNLLLNALKYTRQGGVTVTWEEATQGDLERWRFSVQDTGPGFQRGPAAPLAHAIEESTLEARAVEQAEEHAEPPSTGGELSPASGFQSTAGRAYQPAGEGIGLAIVKRLCELLDATLELETERNKGSTFRVIFPRRYDAP